MSDKTLRELLELAAKAIGGTLSEGHTKRRTGETWDQWEWIGEPGIVTPGSWKPHGSVVIHPQSDDGDSRQLQVALAASLEFRQGATLHDETVAVAKATHGWVKHEAKESCPGNDLAAGARLAVLRAAAEIGRAKP